MLNIAHHTDDFLQPEPAFFATPANDNQKADGQHEWPAFNRLRAGKLMRTPEANRAALAALVRLRQDLTVAEGYGEQWTAASDSAAIDEDVARNYGADLKIEFATAEHLMALYLDDKLEYGEAQPGMTVACKKGEDRIYVLDDRLRGERGPAKPEHPQDVEHELNGRYAGAHWPSAPEAAKSARHLFNGAQIKTKGPVRTWKSPDSPIIERMFSERTLAFVKGGMPAGLWTVMEATATGSSAEAIGVSRGHNGKYGSAVGTELQRMALEALIEIFADYDGCHLEAA